MEWWIICGETVMVSGRLVSRESPVQPESFISKRPRKVKMAFPSKAPLFEYSVMHCHMNQLFLVDYADWCVISGFPSSHCRLSV